MKESNQIHPLAGNGVLPSEEPMELAKEKYAKRVGRSFKGLWRFITSFWQS